MGIADEGNAAAVVRDAGHERREQLLNAHAEGKTIRNWLASFEDARCVLNVVEEAAEMERVMACICEGADCSCRVLDAELQAVSAFIKERSAALEKRRTEYLTSKGLTLEDFP